MKLFTCNLGCKVNAYETRAVTSLFLNKGYKLGTEKDFDVALINTCTVTNMASQKSRQHIRKLRNINHKAIIVVMGCYVTLNAESIIKDCGADIVIGVSHRKDILKLIDEFKKRKKPIILVDKVNVLRKKVNYEELGFSSFNENTRAYVKISDGCDNFCSYCIIPIVRGRLRSRKKEDILHEVKELIKLGYKEIVLTGVDTSNYGKEFKNYRLTNLIDDILKNNPNLFRLRLSSVEIHIINNDFLNLLKKYPQIADHLHISLQSGSNSVLKRMNRHYSTNEFKKKIIALRKVRPNIALTTDIIVGFPNETEKEFKETCQFVKEIKFYRLHIFPFSPRINTAAYLMKDTSSLVKKARVKILEKINQQLTNDYESRFIDKSLPVLFESNHTGLTSNYLRVRGNYQSNSIHTVLIKKNRLVSN